MIPERATELSIAQAVARLAALTPAVQGEETVGLDAAHARVLARDLASHIDLPAFDNAAMDGYALRHVDLGAVLRPIGHSYAGHGFDGAVGPGTCVRIMTGAPLPAGADTVVMLEDTRPAGEMVDVVRAPLPGANIRRRAEHIAAGAVALPAGTWLDDAAVGLAASVGVDRVPVLRRLRVALLSTGDELADPPQPLTAAGAYDANRPFLQAGCARLGFDTLDLGICPDRGDAFATAVQRALDDARDVLLISGGAAQGDADVVRQAGGVQFLPLDIRPGRGIAHALLQHDGRRLLLLGLPGNAVAAFVMFHLVARPVLLGLAGACHARPLPRLQAPLAHEVRLRGGRIDYRRGRLDDEGRVTLLKDQGSAMLRTVIDADCLVAVGPGEHHAAGARVPVVPLKLLL